VDVGSRIDGFVAHVAAFREIEVFDIRALTVEVPNIRFRQCDVMALPAEFVEYSDSVSCLHALEHFGLGRYNDPVCYDGHEIGLCNLIRMLRPGGTLYLSVPIGPQRIEFNGHRVFSVTTVLELAGPTLQLRALSYVDDEGCLREASLTDIGGASHSFGVHYGCGIFEFEKRRDPAKNGT
jgi:SAM-dependent methyltransferase